MRLWVFNILAGVSAAVFLCTGLLWIASYRGQGVFWPAHPETGSSYFHSARGELGVRVCDQAAAGPVQGWLLTGWVVWAGLPGEVEYRRPGSLAGTWWDRGFVEVQATQRFGNPLIPFWAINIPHRQLILLAGVLPVCWLTRRLRRSVRQRRRREGGLCLHCGYNLTGNTSGICPECGKAIAPSEIKA